MKTFSFTSPDGVNYEVTGPDDATEAQAFQILQQQIQAGTAQPTSAEADSPNATQAQATIVNQAEQAADAGVPQTKTPVEQVKSEVQPTWYEPNSIVGNLVDGAKAAAGRFDLDHLTTNLKLAASFDRNGSVQELQSKVDAGTASAAEKEALQQFKQENIEPNLPAARKAIAADPQKYAGMSEQQVAVDLSTAKDLGDAVEVGTTLATLPIGGGAKLLGQTLIGAGSAAGATLANQATQSAYLGENRLDPEQVATNATLAGGGTAVLGTLGKIAGRVLSPKIAKVAENVADEDVAALQRVNQYNQSAAPADQINLNPQQVFKADTAGANKIRGRADRLTDELPEGQLKANFRGQADNAEKFADDATNQVTSSLPQDSQSFLGSMAGRLQGEARTQASTLYKQNLDAVEDALKAHNATPGNVKITSLKPTTAKQAAADALAESERMGGVTLGSHANTLNAFMKAKPQSFAELDKWKRTLNESARKANTAGDYEAANAIKDVVSKLKEDAYAHANALGANVGDYYKAADQNYTVLSKDYGKGSLGKALSDQNYDSKVVDRLLKPKTGTDDIAEMRRLAAKSQDPDDILHLQNAITGSVLERGIAKATGNRTADFNYGAMGKQIRQHMPHLEEALKGNQAALDNIKTLGQVFDTMRTADFNRGTLQSSIAKAGNQIANKIADPVTAGTLGLASAGPIGAVGGVLGSLGFGAAKRGYSRFQDKSLANLSQWAVQHADEIAAFKAAGKGRNVYLKEQSARRLADSFTAMFGAQGNDE